MLCFTLRSFQPCSLRPKLTSPYVKTTRAPVPCLTFQCPDIVSCRAFVWHQQTCPDECLCWLSQPLEMLTGINVYAWLAFWSPDQWCWAVTFSGGYPEVRLPGRADHSMEIISLLLFWHLVWPYISSWLSPLYPKLLIYLLIRSRVSMIRYLTVVYF